MILLVFAEANSHRQVEEEVDWSEIRILLYSNVLLARKCSVQRILHTKEASFDPFQPLTNFNHFLLFYFLFHHTRKANSCLLTFLIGIRYFPFLIESIFTSVWNSTDQSHLSSIHRYLFLQLIILELLSSQCSLIKQIHRIYRTIQVYW